MAECKLPSINGKWSVPSWDHLGFEHNSPCWYSGRIFVPKGQIREPAERLNSDTSFHLKGQVVRIGVRSLWSHV